MGATPLRSPPQRFCKTMAASYASRRDLRLTDTRVARAKNFQKCYQRLIAAAGPYEQVLRQVRDRSAVINHEHRMTGNGVIHVVDEIVTMKDRLNRNELQGAMDAFIESQVLVPGRWTPLTEELRGDSPKARLMRAMQKDLVACKETV
jgi:hypothetical protein